MKKTLKRILSSGLVICFLASHLTEVGLAAPLYKEETPVFVKALPQDLDHVSLKAKDGKILETHRGSSSQTIVLVQDAHSIPEAQRSIEKIIHHFQSQYGIRKIAAEGASEQLDPQFLKSFPDKEKLGQVLEHYFERGELTGVNAAAIRNEIPNTDFLGVEDWALYEKGLQLYLNAQTNQSVLQMKIQEWRQDLEVRKAKEYSKELLEIDQAIQSSHADHHSFLELVKKLASFQKPKPGSELAAVFAEIEKEEQGGFPRPVMNLESERFLSEFENYASDIKTSWLRTPAEKELNEETSQLDLSERLSKLELRREDWEQLKGRMGKWENGREEFKFHQAFYENAELREDALLKNLINMLSHSPNRPFTPSILIAGGFHTQGLIEKIKKQGLSYVLVMPSISQIPETIHYTDHMRGEVSWKNYFQVKNGRINLYEAFVRAMRDQLLTVEGGSMKAEEKHFLLKYWRDELIRGLSSEGKIEKAEEYLRFLDELVGSKNIDRFIAGLKNLQATDQVTEQNILNILKPSTIVSGYLGGLQRHASLPQNLWARPETRVKVTKSNLGNLEKKKFAYNEERGLVEFIGKDKKGYYFQDVQKNHYFYLGEAFLETGVTGRLALYYANGEDIKAHQNGEVEKAVREDESILGPKREAIKASAQRWIPKTKPKPYEQFVSDATWNFLSTAKFNLKSLSSEDLKKLEWNISLLQHAKENRRIKLFSLQNATQVENLILGFLFFPENIHHYPPDVNFKKADLAPDINKKLKVALDHKGQIAEGWILKLFAKLDRKDFQSIHVRHWRKHASPYDIQRWIREAIPNVELILYGEFPEVRGRLHPRAESREEADPLSIDEKIKLWRSMGFSEFALEILKKKHTEADLKEMHAIFFGGDKWAFATRANKAMEWAQQNYNLGLAGRLMKWADFQIQTKGVSRFQVKNKGAKGTGLSIVGEAKLRQGDVAFAWKESLRLMAASALRILEGIQETEKNPTQNAVPPTSGDEESYRQWLIQELRRLNAASNYLLYAHKRQIGFPLPSENPPVFHLEAIKAHRWAGMVPTIEGKDLAEILIKNGIQNISFISASHTTPPALQVELMQPHVDAVTGLKIASFAVALLKQPGVLEFSEETTRSLVFTEPDDLDQKIKKMRNLIQLALEEKVLLSSPYQVSSDPQEREKLISILGRTPSETEAIRLFFEAGYIQGTATAEIERKNLAKKDKSSKDLLGQMETGFETLKIYHALGKMKLAVRPGAVERAKKMALPGISKLYADPLYGPLAELLIAEHDDKKDWLVPQQDMGKLADQLERASAVLLENRKNTAEGEKSAKNPQQRALYTFELLSGILSALPYKPAMLFINDVSILQQVRQGLAVLVTQKISPETSVVFPSLVKATKNKSGELEQKQRFILTEVQAPLNQVAGPALEEALTELEDFENNFESIVDPKTKPSIQIKSPQGFEQSVKSLNHWLNELWGHQTEHSKQVSFHLYKRLVEFRRLAENPDQHRQVLEKSRGLAPVQSLRETIAENLILKILSEIEILEAKGDVEAILKRLKAETPLFREFEGWKIWDAKLAKIRPAFIGRVAEIRSRYAVEIEEKQNRIIREFLTAIEKGEPYKGVNKVINHVAKTHVMGGLPYEIRSLLDKYPNLGRSETRKRIVPINGSNLGLIPLTIRYVDYFLKLGIENQGRIIWEDGTGSRTIRPQVLNGTDLNLMVDFQDHEILSENYQGNREYAIWDNPVAVEWDLEKRIVSAVYISLDQEGSEYLKLEILQSKSHQEIPFNTNHIIFNETRRGGIIMPEPLQLPPSIDKVILRSSLLDHEAFDRLQASPAYRAESRAIAVETEWGVPLFLTGVFAVNHEEILQKVFAKGSPAQNIFREFAQQFYFNPDVIHLSTSENPNVGIKTMREPEGDLHLQINYDSFQSEPTINIEYALAGAFIDEYIRRLDRTDPHGVSLFGALVLNGDTNTVRIENERVNFRPVVETFYYWANYRKLMEFGADETARVMAGKILQLDSTFNNEIPPSATPAVFQFNQLMGDMNQALLVSSFTGKARRELEANLRKKIGAKRAEDALNFIQNTPEVQVLLESSSLPYLTDIFSNYVTPIANLAQSRSESREPVQVTTEAGKRVLASFHDDRIAVETGLTSRGLGIQILQTEDYLEERGTVYLGEVIGRILEQKGFAALEKALTDYGFNKVKKENYIMPGEEIRSREILEWISNMEDWMKGGDSHMNPILPEESAVTQAFVGYIEKHYGPLTDLTEPKVQQIVADFMEPGSKIQKLLLEAGQKEMDEWIENGTFSHHLNAGGDNDSLIPQGLEIETSIDGRHLIVNVDGEIWAWASNATKFVTQINQKIRTSKYQLREGARIDMVVLNPRTQEKIKRRISKKSVRLNSGLRSPVTDMPDILLVPYRLAVKEEPKTRQAIAEILKRSLVLRPESRVHSRSEFRTVAEKVFTEIEMTGNVLHQTASEIVEAGALTILNEIQEIRMAYTQKAFGRREDLTAFIERFQQKHGGERNKAAVAVNIAGSKETERLAAKHAAEAGKLSGSIEKVFVTGTSLARRIFYGFFKKAGIEAQTPGDLEEALVWTEGKVLPVISDAKNPKAHESFLYISGDGDPEDQETETVAIMLKYVVGVMASLSLKPEQIRKTGEISELLKQLSEIGINANQMFHIEDGRISLQMKAVRAFIQSYQAQLSTSRAA